jgi:hypothetical protein
MRRDFVRANISSEQRWLHRLVVLVVVTVALVAPRSAWAALAVPMCSPFGESMVAPPPESPPTGGEIRTVATHDPRAPSIDLAPSDDQKPLPWQQPTTDPAVATPPSVVRIAMAIATYQPLGLKTNRGPHGVRIEVFRPPCSE